MPIENVTLSAKARDQLTALKRRTGIENWNVLCRWALCVSLAEATPPANAKHAADSSLEMAWKTFAGQHDELYWALIRQRCEIDGIDPSDEEIVANSFRQHLHRGIAYLAGDKDLQSIGDLVRRAVHIA